MDRRRFLALAAAGVFAECESDPAASPTEGVRPLCRLVPAEAIDARR